LKKLSRKGIQNELHLTLKLKGQVHQKVTPPDPDPLRKPSFFLSMTTVLPEAAASWTTVGAQPGGGGGIVGGA
jgi:hypothetical protein